MLRGSVEGRDAIANGPVLQGGYVRYLHVYGMFTDMSDKQKHHQAHQEYQEHQVSLSIPMTSCADWR